MNQILLTDNKDFNKKNKGSSANIQKIILFSSIAILIFAILIISVYSYKIYKNKHEEEIPVSKPLVSLEETEENTDVRIIAQADVGISKIIYIWNDENPVELNMRGRTSHEEALEIPIGENILKVKVIDLNNQEIETSKTFNKLPEEKPIITTEIDQDAKLKITATVTDETAIQYIAYKWDDEEETKVKAENIDDTLIEVKIDVKRGNHSLVIKAVDSHNNEETITKQFKGVNKPIIEVTRDGEIIYMKIKHDMGFERIEFAINNKIYKYDRNFAGYDANRTEIEYKCNLQEGENRVVILAFSTEDTMAIYKGKCVLVSE